MMVSIPSVRNLGTQSSPSSVIKLNWNITTFYFHHKSSLCCSFSCLSSLEKLVLVLMSCFFLGMFSWQQSESHRYSVRYGRGHSGLARSSPFCFCVVLIVCHFCLWAKIKARWTWKMELGCLFHRWICFPATLGLYYGPHKSGSCFTLAGLCLICQDGLSAKFFHQVTKTCSEVPTRGFATGSSLTAGNGGMVNVLVFMFVKCPVTEVERVK